MAQRAPFSSGGGRRTNRPFFPSATADQRHELRPRATAQTARSSAPVSRSGRRTPDRDIDLRCILRVRQVSPGAKIQDRTPQEQNQARQCDIISGKQVRK